MCLNGLDVDGLLLLLLLNGIGSVGISLCGVGLLLQGGALQGQVIVLDGDGSIGVHAGVVGLFVGMCHLNLHVALGIGTVDGGIFLDFGGIVGTQVVNESFLVGDVLNVTRDNLDAQLAHVGRGFLHHLVGESVAVGIERAQVERTDNLTHVTLQRVFQLVGNHGRCHVQEVLGSQSCALGVGCDAYLGHCVDIHIDEVVGGHALLGLDVDGNLSEIHLVQTLEERHADASRADEHTRLAADTRDDVSIRWRCFDVRH